MLWERVGCAGDLARVGAVLVLLSGLYAPRGAVMAAGGMSPDGTDEASRIADSSGGTEKVEVLTVTSGAGSQLPGTFEVLSDEESGSSSQLSAIESDLLTAKTVTGSTREVLLRGLWQHFDTQTLEAELSIRMDSKDLEDVKLAVETYLYHGEEGKKVLVGLLSAPDSRQADLVAYALTDIGAPAEPVLAEGLNLPSSQARKRCIRELGRLANESWADALGDLARDPSVEIRLAAVDALGYMSPKARKGNLKRFVNDRDPAVRLRVVEFYACQPDPGSAEALNKLAVDSDPAVRTATVVALREQAVSGVTALEGLLKDPLESIRAEASRGLVEQTPLSRKLALVENRDPVIHEAALETILVSPDVPVEVLSGLANVWDLSVRRQAVARIISSSDEGASAAVQAFVTDSDTKTQMDAVSFLIKRELERNPSALIPVAISGSLEAKRMVVNALVAAATPETAKVLVHFLDNPDAALRKTMVAHLGKVGCVETVSGLARMARDPDLEVRRQVLYSLATMPFDEVLRPLTVFLDDQEAIVRQEAAYAMGYRENPELVLALSAHSDDTSREVRHAVLCALTRIGDDVAAGAISVFFHDPDEALRFEALQALEKIGSPMAAALMGELFQHKDASLRRAGIVALESQRLEQPEAVARALQNFLHDPVSSNQMLAIKASAATANGEAIAGLLELAREQEVRTRRQAVWALQWVRDRDAVVALEELAHDDDIMVRQGVYVGLARVGGQRGYELLIEGLDDPLEMVRLSVIRSLADLRLGMAVPKLIERLDKADLPEQGAIIDALARIGSDAASNKLVELIRYGEEPQKKLASRALQRAIGGWDDVAEAVLLEMDLGGV